MAVSSVNRLITNADKAARAMGGLILLLLALKRRDGLAAVSWDAKRLQFVIDGRLVPLVTIQKQLDLLEDKLAAKIALYNGRLFNGTYTLPVWREKMTELVENSHVLFAAFALGSISLAARNAVVIRKLQRDGAALERFFAALQNGAVPNTLVANRRGKSYIRSARVTYELLRHRLHIEAGYTEAKRVLSPAEHCRNRLGPGGIREGCLEAARRGWLPIRQMPPIGTLVCGQFCKCTVIYR